MGLNETFEQTDKGEMGPGLRALNLIAAALWIPILAWCLLIFIMIISQREPFSDSHLPQYPVPYDVERNNQHTVRPWSNMYPRPGLSFPPVNMRKLPIGPTVPSVAERMCGW
jgi:hypothetical protein